MFYPFETQATPLTTVRRERILPAPGDVFVHINQRVEPAQVVAQTELPGEFHIIPVARWLKIPSSGTKRYKRCLRVKPGDAVEKGQVLAKRPFQRPVRSPIDGTVTASGAGRILVEAPPVSFELHAYIPGTVSNVLSDYGVVIETKGAVIQGIWGSGEESFGVLKCLVKRPDELLKARAIDPSCHGTILVAGAGLNQATLEMAQEMQVQGIVAGGLPPELVSQVTDLPFPIVVTEGIGVVPMSEPIFRLLKTNDGREAAINGRVQSGWDPVRPEIVVPMPADTSAEEEFPPGSPLAVGMRVRAVRAPYMGKVGTVTSLPPLPRPIETGAKVLGAEVDVGDESPVFIPLANLEVLR